MNKISYDRLRELLKYSPETGILIWRVGRGSVLAGSAAGNVGPDGYRRIKIDGKKYREHRLAWMYEYGYFPENQIDHINRIKNDNRISNLREVSQSCNIRNSDPQCNNTSGVCGVSWHARDKKWRADIKVNGKLFHLGYYHDFDDAVCARLAAEQCLNWESCNSSSDAHCYVRDNIQGL